MGAVKHALQEVEDFVAELSRRRENTKPNNKRC